MQIRSVTEVTRYIKALIDSDLTLGDLWIAGEVSNFKRHTSGHCYFTLKDSDAELRCVMWRRDADRLGWAPEQGAWVEAHGYLSVYERAGSYQLYVDALQHGGVGLLWQQFMELRDRLEREGLFEPERKRPLPAWPQRIGLVTSFTGAARRDIENVLRARYPLVELVVAGCAVQGFEAPGALCGALGSLGQMPGLDLVIVARGGGSLEDLWAFNDERVARAIAACPVPVITGVGHETDFTIADFAADLRAPTPSAAAAAAVPDQRELRAQLGDTRARLYSAMTSRLQGERERLAGERRLLRLHDPRRRVAEQRQRVDDQARRLTLATQRQLALWRTRVRGRVDSLRALDARGVLQRGYALLYDRPSGKRVASVTQVAPADELLVCLHDGEMTARVTEVLSPSAD